MFIAYYLLFTDRWLFVSWSDHLRNFPRCILPCVFRSLGWPWSYGIFAWKTPSGRKQSFSPPIYFLFFCAYDLICIIFTWSQSTTWFQTLHEKNNNDWKNDVWNGVVLIAWFIEMKYEKQRNIKSNQRKQQHNKSLLAVYVCDNNPI